MLGSQSYKAPTHTMHIYHIFSVFRCFSYNSDLFKEGITARSFHIIWLNFQLIRIQTCSFVWSSFSLLVEPKLTTNVKYKKREPSQYRIFDRFFLQSSDVKKTFFLCWVEKNRYSSGFIPNFSGIFIISCIICISELPAKE